MDNELHALENNRIGAFSTEDQLPHFFYDPNGYSFRCTTCGADHAKGDEDHQPDCIIGQAFRRGYFLGHNHAHEGIHTYWDKETNNTDTTKAD